jgi:uroporphyrinogen decarboxylase
MQVIRHGKPDRMPIYGWVRANMADPIAAAYGSVEAFEDRFEFDFAHLFGGPSAYPKEAMDGLRQKGSGEILPEALLTVPLSDPNETAAYDSVRQQIRHHKQQRGRFVYMQTPGIFECLNGVFGIERHLEYLLLYPEHLHQVYRRQAEWNRAFAHNVLDAGVDMVHVSDDWGAQHSLLFSPRTWWTMIHPYHKITCDAVLGRGAFLSLHTDGNNLAVMDGILDLGYQVIHPWQESAGMSLSLFHDRYRGVLTAMGGLDVQTTIGFGRREILRSEIERVMRLFADGGLLFCTSHFVQNHCTIEELTFAFETAYELSRAVACGRR